MRKYLLIILLIFLFFILNPIGLINVINEINQIDEINQINQNAWAQDSKKQPGAGTIQPAPANIKVLKHPYQILSFEIHESYVIGQEDVLEVVIWRNEKLSRQVTVRPDGKISLPLIRDLQAEGLTVPQLKDQITRRLSEYLEQPKVTVIVSQINSYKVSVLGRVVNPGEYPITGKTKLVEAIAKAGGFTEWANKRKITVITHQGRNEKKITVNYKKIISGKDPSQNIKIKRGDIIIVN
jgi:polysaccharide export outer membrane protein